MSRVERNGQRDDLGVEAVSFLPSAISRMVGRMTLAVRQRNRDPTFKEPGPPVRTSGAPGLSDLNCLDYMRNTPLTE